MPCVYSNESNTTVFKNSGHPLGGKKRRKGKLFTLDPVCGEQAHRYALFNSDCKELDNYIRFYTKVRDAKCKTQNSGVSVRASTPSFASSRDKNPVVGDVDYYGAIIEIIELNYWSKSKVVLFYCEWYQVEKDDYGLPYVNMKKLCSLNDPYVMPSQVHQVFYVPDPLVDSLQYVMNRVPRDLYEGDYGINDGNTYWSELHDNEIHPVLQVGVEDIQLSREDMPIQSLMGNQRQKDDLEKNSMTAYERVRMLRVQENQAKMRELGLKDIGNTMPSLVTSTKLKNKKQKSLGTSNYDAEQFLDENGGGKDDESSSTYGFIPTKVQTARQKYIPPMSVQKYVELRKKHRTPPPMSKELPIASRVKARHNQTSRQVVQDNVAKNKMSGDATTVDANLDDIEGNSWDNNDNEEQNQIGGEDDANERNENDIGCESMNIEEQSVSSEDDTNELDEQAFLNIQSQPTGREYKYAPLVYQSWKKVPDKEKMWEYVLEKYIIPDVCKSWVLKSIGAAWRGYKCRVKRKHFSKYKDYKSRWNNRPKTIPEKDFLKLLGVWNQKEVKEAMKNYKPSTMESGDADPFLAVMGKDYDGRCRLYGRGVTRKMLNKVSAPMPSYMVSEEVFESLRSTTEIEQRYKRDKAELEHLQKEIEANNERQRLELEKMRRDIDLQHDKIVEDAVQKLKDGGWIRQQAFWIAKQLLQLGMGMSVTFWIPIRLTWNGFRDLLHQTTLERTVLSHQRAGARKSGQFDEPWRGTWTDGVELLAVTVGHDVNQRLVHPGDDAQTWLNANMANQRKCRDGSLELSLTAPVMGRRKSDRVDQ
ncbi:hypothetical protein ZIOFF_039559 [Zingiber officinale]|uniref:DUF4216 domain-containing protein n=1 Tax=Zingiber officinale TaxID=94328 RepID=A0A8J5L097_ZINOF|nr:hypothetical protein ZIOFF_039559 [Zingiber officinale]